MNIREAFEAAMDGKLMTRKEWEEDGMAETCLIYFDRKTQSMMSCYYRDGKFFRSKAAFFDSRDVWQIDWFEFKPLSGTYPG